MSEVYRYKAVQLISESGGRIGYDPYGPDVVMAIAYDEQRAQLAERDALLRECFKALLKAGHSKPLRERIKSALSASAEPSAPVERDERAAFERFCVDSFNRCCNPTTPMKMEWMLAARRGEKYSATGWSKMWEAWKARAALERKG
ncbi:hypothetical protein [Pseudomonas putida]|uniref:hypothetical protein n=1 Tax=Pseudomonas putida TaxID=303 RepID=UPI001F1ADE63|nr:hypothetical protein [Pseudomonas putida]